MEESKTPIIIIGTGPEARAALDAANALDVMVYGFLTDDDSTISQEINDILVIAKLGNRDSDTLLEDENIKLVVAARDIEHRHNLVKYLAIKKPELINLIHPFSSISSYAKIGKGNLIYPGVIVHANALVGSYNLIETGVSIDIDTQIGDFCTLQTGARIGREVMIHKDVIVGMGAVIHPGLTIGEGAMIGPGAVVLKNVDPGQTVFGNPAKPTN
ncbi:MAG: NeuD/PglB/VioB family sugar acetyltransferase [Bacteroidia bacterium]|nr:NeuD/PglB/VioB family sugar acetyltransferase [Bacteroidia bacterium]